VLRSAVAKCENNLGLTPPRLIIKHGDRRHGKPLLKRFRPPAPKGRAFAIKKQTCQHSALLWQPPPSNLIPRTPTDGTQDPSTACDWGIPRSTAPLYAQQDLPPAQEVIGFAFIHKKYRVAAQRCAGSPARPTNLRWNSKPAPPRRAGPVAKASGIEKIAGRASKTNPPAIATRQVRINVVEMKVDADAFLLGTSTSPNN